MNTETLNSMINELEFKRDNEHSKAKDATNRACTYNEVIIMLRNLKLDHIAGASKMVEEEKS